MLITVRRTTPRSGGAWHESAPFTAQAGGNYEGWIPPGAHRLIPGIPVKNVALEMIFRTQTALAHADFLPKEYKSALIKASLIAASTPTAADYPKVAAVIENRLSLAMPFQLDSTVAHAALGEQGYFDDSPTRVDIRYNTFEAAGLPPGPVGAVTPSAIEAAAHPAEGD